MSETVVGSGRLITCRVTRKFYCPQAGRILRPGDGLNIPRSIYQSLTRGDFKYVEEYKPESQVRLASFSVLLRAVADSAIVSEAVDALNLWLISFDRSAADESIDESIDESADESAKKKRGRPRKIARE